MKTHRILSRPLQRGLSLVELMVAMAIGLIVVLAITSLIVVSQTQERTTGGSNDMNQSSAYAATVVDQALRSAGAGFAQGWDLGAMGCLPSVSRTSGSNSSIRLLPRSTALPAPFADLLGSTPENLRIAPLLIAQGQSGGGSDILAVMSGSAGVGEIPRNVRDRSGNGVRLDNTLAFHANDLLLLSGPATETCVVTQVASTFVNGSGPAGVLSFGGSYAGDEAALSTFMTAENMNEGLFVNGLGNAASGNLSMQLFGVGTDRVLYRYDLLRQSGNDASEAMAEGVVAMRAIYNVDTNIDDRVAPPAPTWTAPAGDYDIEALLDLAPRERAQALRRIVGVRVSLLLRSSARQSQIAARDEYVMLDGLPGEETVALSTAERHFAHRLVEVTIPLRNALMVQPELEP